jgi:large subunit ribosomal protein L29
MKFINLKDLGSAELSQRESVLRREMFNIRIQKKAGNVENPLRARNARRELARVLTLAMQRKKSS